MDILSIIQAVWRHKLASAIVVLMVACGCAYVLVVQPSQYESTGTVLLVPPPRPPTEAEVAADPALRSLNLDNPYSRDYNPGVMINLVAGLVVSEPSKRALVQAGADPRFTIAQTVLYGFSSPVASISAKADSPAQARRSAELVVTAFQDRLQALQASEKLDQRAFIGSRLIDKPALGSLRVSGKLRGLLGVVGLGVIGLFTVVSTADAFDRNRRERRRRIAGLEPVARTPDVPSQPTEAEEPQERPAAVRALPDLPSERTPISRHPYRVLTSLIPVEQDTPGPPPADPAEPPGPNQGALPEPTFRPRPMLSRRPDQGAAVEGESDSA